MASDWASMFRIELQNAESGWYTDGRSNQHGAQPNDGWETPNSGWYSEDGYY